MKRIIRFGIPEVNNYITDLIKKKKADRLAKDEKRFLKKFKKILSFLEENPKHPSLKSHEIKPLSNRYGMKVWQSYLENKTPAAGRIFWVYGPDKNDITIIGIEPHPEDSKKAGYQKVKLSNLSAA